MVRVLIISRSPSEENGFWEFGNENEQVGGLSLEKVRLYQELADSSTSGVILKKSVPLREK